MKFYKYQKCGDVTEYLAVSDTITQYSDVVINSYPDSVRLLIMDNANSPTIERASFIPFQDEIEISEMEFFEVWRSAMSSLVDVLQQSTFYKMNFQIDQVTKNIRDKVVEGYLDRLFTGITDQSGAVP